MSTPIELTDLEQRLGCVEDTLADAQARLPALRREVGEIRAALRKLDARTTRRDGAAIDRRP